MSKLDSRDRLLKLIEIMQKYSDEENKLSIGDIIEEFPHEADIKPATLKQDLAALAKSDLFRVHEYWEKNGVEKLYWYDGIGLKLHELRLLLDAIVAARFIPPKETHRLVEQLKRFAGNHLAEQMDNQLFLADEPGAALKNIGDSIHVLHEAIQNQNTISFQYGKYGTDRKFHLNRNGDFYRMNPYALTWSQDFYYLIAIPVDKEEKRHFRVDRMRNIYRTDDRFIKNPNFNIPAYLKKLFHMYSGEEIDMEVEFDNHLINVVIDRFGPEADIRPMDNGHFKLFTKAIYADGLVRWLLTWGGDAKVLYPPKLVKRMEEEAEKFYQTYY
ncbi:helix-turn-helix transcriptional regulator [Bacillus marinisedimentorum]|uniref:helix-turn-helix transcriptional regulator n=1 Tax=Bacillus marinisedimentorum TaxID=1821260 RepID=UPI0009F4D974|nr:WYL domain-containing protein [Bacillus marinisedimentorum]